MNFIPLLLVFTSSLVFVDCVKTAQPQVLAKFVPEPLKAQLPKQVLDDLNKLTTKDYEVRLMRVN
jgi:hypothetical protein